MENSLSFLKAIFYIKKSTLKLFYIFFDYYKFNIDIRLFINMYKLEETILYFDNVTAGYGDKIILKDINLCEKNVVREGIESTGQTIAFIGRSGRGKSTLFKVLSGLLKPLSGRVLVANVGGKEKDEAKVVSEGDIGFVDQKYTLFRHKTVMETFQYAMRKRTITPEAKKALIDKYLNDWGLMAHKDQYPNELSGGQRQRTAIIEQILSSKHFMILDEPFSGLDVGNIENVKKSFKMISDSNELNTIIFSTHDLKLAVELADSIYIVGNPEGVNDYSTIIKHFDLKEMGIAWTEFGQHHLDLMNEIKEVLLKS